MIEKTDFPSYPNGGAYFDTLTKGLLPSVSLEAMNDAHKWETALRAGLHTRNRKSTEAYENAKNILAKFLCILPDQLAIMGSIDHNLFLLLSSLKKANNKLKLFLHSDDHHSILSPAISIGSQIEWLKEESIYEQLQDLIDENSVVLIADLSPLTGVRRDLEKLANLIHDKGGKVIVDLSRSILQHIVDIVSFDYVVIDCALDLLGPTAISLLYMQEFTSPAMMGFRGISTIQRGVIIPIAGMEQYEPGFLNLPALMALSRNIDYFERIGIENIRDHHVKLQKYFLDKLYSFSFFKDGIIQLVNKEREPVQSFTYSFHLIEPLSVHDIALLLEETGRIAVRSGLGCTHIAAKSRGYSEFLQLSFHIYNTCAEIDLFFENLENILNMLL